MELTLSDEAFGHRSLVRCEFEAGVSSAQFDGEQETILFVSATADVLRCDTGVWESFLKRVDKNQNGSPELATAELARTLTRLGVNIGTE